MSPVLVATPLASEYRHDLKTKRSTVFKGIGRHVRLEEGGDNFVKPGLLHIHFTKKYSNLLSMLKIIKFLN